MHYDNVGSPVLLIDKIGKLYSNCGSRDCIRSPKINETLYEFRADRKLGAGSYVI